MHSGTIDEIITGSNQKDINHSESYGSLDEESLLLSSDIVNVHHNRSDREEDVPLHRLSKHEKKNGGHNSRTDLFEMINNLEEENYILRKLVASEGFTADRITKDQHFCFSLVDRGAWLFGLLFFQSTSSFILAANQKLIDDHPAIIYFLTMVFFIISGN